MTSRRKKNYFNQYLCVKHCTTMASTLSSRGLDKNLRRNWRRKVENKFVVFMRVLHGFLVFWYQAHYEFNKAWIFAIVCSTEIDTWISWIEFLFFNWRLILSHLFVFSFFLICTVIRCKLQQLPSKYHMELDRVSYQVHRSLKSQVISRSLSK